MLIKTSLAVSSSNEITLLFVVSTFYKVDFYTLLSVCSEVTFSCKYLSSTSLFAGNHVVTKVEMCADLCA